MHIQSQWVALSRLAARTLHREGKGSSRAHNLLEAERAYGLEKFSRALFGDPRYRGSVGGGTAPARVPQLDDRLAGREHMPTFRVGCGSYTVTGTVGSVPSTYDALRQHATTHDDLGIAGSAGTVLVVELSRSGDVWPALLIAQRFSPGPDAGFHPGVFLVPEHHRLFVGAGTQLLAYDLNEMRRLWSDEADTGFWGWARHSEAIVMSAELELAAWDLKGRKLWTTFVEPPWEYRVREGVIELDVMGKKSSFALAIGPRAGTAD